MPTRKTRRTTDQVRDKILEEATTLFIERGYAATSMNALTARVGGSKGTLYQQFGSKQALFAAVLDHVLVEHMAQLDAIDFDELELEAGLVAIARVTLATVSSPRALGIWRLLYAEAPRAPEIGTLFIEHGPDKTFAGVRRFFAKHTARGHLTCIDPARAAEYFVGMLLHKPMLYRYVEVQAPFTPRQLSRIARRVSRDFLAMNKRCRC